MSYVTSRHGDLLVAAHAADERTITRALKRLDDRLLLALNLDLDTQRHVWQVVCRYGGDRPAEIVLSWRDDYGRPLPLSHALVEEVKRLRQVDTLAQANAHNARMRERANHDDFNETLAVVSDMVPRIKGRRMSILHRGVHLRRSRHKPGGKWSE